MFAPYGFILPNALPPLVEVPLDFDSPFATSSGRSQSTSSAKEGDRSDSQQHTLETKPSFVNHNSRHHHVNLPEMMHKVHLPTFHGAHPGVAPPPHSRSNFHFPHFSLPSLAWPHIAHSTPSYATNLTSWVPRADVRDAASAYFIEIEVPGLQAGNEDQVLVQWMTPRTIVVSGDIERAALPAEPVAATNTEENGADKDSAEDGESLKRVPSHEDGEAPPPGPSDSPASTFLICERHVGYWRRSFTLPPDVDLDVDPSRNSSCRSLEYKIEAGVLVIRIPKVKK